MECDGLFFRARGIEAREVASSGAHRPHSIPKAVHPSAKLDPRNIPSHTSFLLLRGRPPFVLGLGLTGIPVHLCSASGQTYSQFPEGEKPAKEEKLWRA